LSEPLPENLLKAEPKAFTVRARFLFERIAPETVEGAQVGPAYAAGADPSKFSEVDMDGGQSVERGLIATRQSTQGRGLSFYRVNLVSPLDWNLGPLSGYGVSPVVGINPLWFVDAIGNLIHPKAKIDPLDKYRDDPDW
jgi:hypothetical protein